ncbi:MAG: RsmD family RNA methyltransferase [Puniceicoccales bacterium]|jgi:16S rRNA (guanine966-N2)-methyltransferase|nr:RsmD family RNA methyltransferase [Puniceicoccales bacterium]
MRITGGKARGIPLVSIQDKTLRPATDCLREALFSSLSSWIYGKVFLDLFSGTGSYGLEALSRGAQSGVFVEKSSRIVDILRLNIQAVAKSLRKQPAPCKIIHHDIWHLNLLAEWKFDIIFLDPPFNLSRVKAQELLNHASSFLKDDRNSKICFELPADIEAPSHDLRWVKRIGKTTGQSPTIVLYEAR